MKALILALAVLCGAAVCEAADSFYFSNGRFSIQIGPQPPRYYRPPYSYWSPYANPYQYRSPYSYPYYPRSPYYAPQYPPRHYPHPHNPPRHDQGRRPHRGCN